MARWRPQHYRQEALASGADRTVAERAARTGALTTSRHPDRPPVFSLGHLAHLADVPYLYLRDVVARQVPDAYRLVRIHKRVSSDSGRYRVICIPDPRLLRVQRWIAQAILRTASPHEASTAFAVGDRVVTAARAHCAARWLIKLDVQNFFESITEISVYRVFIELGYQPLVAFELARLCTRVRGTEPYRGRRWRARTWPYKIKAYWSSTLGYLPQGAPTSPMLSNMSARAFDEEVAAIATTHNLRYTRYADDISLSTTRVDFSRSEAAAVTGQVYVAMSHHGLSPNRTKTQIAAPGSRKVVLGLLVDGPEPRLMREFKAGMEVHLHCLTHPEIGPARHAEVRGFESILGMRAHLRGLIAHAQSVESDYGAKLLVRFNAADW